MAANKSVGFLGDVYGNDYFFWILVLTEQILVFGQILSLTFCAVFGGRRNGHLRNGS